MIQKIMRTILVTLPVVSLVFATGAAGLVYEVVGQRYLHRLLGSDHTATAVTLAVFLAGLSLGYALCGRLTTRVRNPLRTYALLEGVIGLWALAFPWIFSIVEQLSGGWTFRPPGLLALQGIVVASVLLLPPAMLMGATVPFLTRVGGTTEATLTGTHALVYAVNTAGAFAGALAAGFWLVPVFGLPGTLMRTAWLNLAAAAFFLALSYTPARTAPPQVRPTERPAAPRLSPARLSALALLGGLATMTLENVLFRYASVVFGGSALTFSVVIAVFVAAIALGSGVVSRVRRVAPWTLAALLLGAAATLTGVWFTLDRWPYWAYLLRLGFGTTPVAFFFHQAAILLFLLVLFGLPVALLGAVVPVVFHESLPRVATAGRTSGRLLAWNAAGSLVGSLAGGVLLYTWFDAAQVYMVVPIVACAGALVAAGPLGRRPRIGSTCALLVCGAIFLAQPTHDANRLVIGTHRMREPLPYAYQGAGVFFEELYQRRSIVSLEDGPLATVAVMETADTPGEPGASLSVLINGRSNSDTRADAITLRLAAHLPALWAPSRRNVLVIGLGTGVTAGELARWPDVERIDVAEISPGVVRALEQFAGHTGDVGDDPRLRVHVEDALGLLRRRPREWDLVVSEPSHLWVSGSDTLYTREFYRLVGRGLAEDGVFLQWLHLYDADIEIIGSIARTLRQEFSTIHAFKGATRDLLLVASKKPFSDETAERVRERLARNPAVGASLAELGLRGIDDILEREERDFGMVFRHQREYEIHTLDHPRLAYLAARAAFAGSVVETSDLQGRAGLDEMLWKLERMQRESGGEEDH